MSKTKRRVNRSYQHDSTRQEIKRDHRHKIREILKDYILNKDDVVDIQEELISADEEFFITGLTKEVKDG